MSYNKTEKRDEEVISKDNICPDILKEGIQCISKRKCDYKKKVNGNKRGIYLLDTEPMFYCILKLQSDLIAKNLNGKSLENTAIE